MSIEVEEKQGQPKRPGKCVAMALIGPNKDLYEIHVDEGVPYYFVNEILVTREVYLDALATADKDRWCPECMSDDAVPPEEKPATPEPS